MDWVQFNRSQSKQLVWSQQNHRFQLHRHQDSSQGSFQHDGVCIYIQTLPYLYINFFTTIYHVFHYFYNHCDTSLTNNVTCKMSLDMRRETGLPTKKRKLMWNCMSIRILPLRELWQFVATPTLDGSSWWVSILTLNVIPMDGSWSPPRTTVHLRLVLVESLPSCTLQAKHLPTLNRVSINGKLLYFFDDLLSQIRKQIY